jgi:hypothetical protein
MSRSRNSCGRGHRNFHGYSHNPMWWNHLFTEVPNRRKARTFEHQIARGRDADEICWPHAKRPYSYYW